MAHDRWTPRAQPSSTGLDSLGFLVDSLTVVRMADSVLHVGVHRLELETETFLRDMEGFVVRRVPVDLNARGGGGLVWGGRDSRVVIVHLYQ